MITDKIVNCIDCPFAQNDSEYGLSDCRISNITLKRHEELPLEGVHSDCKLKDNDFLIILSK